MTRSLVSPAEIAARLGVASKQVGTHMRRAGVGRISAAGYDRRAFDRMMIPGGGDHPEAGSAGPARRRRSRAKAG
nr:hypothetical protein [Sphingomonas melonis]